jgi:flagellar basal-body rod modification protein FlgD
VANVIETLGSTSTTPTSVGQKILENNELGKDAFLKLLTIQLQYQDPMDPVQNEDFVAQLAQFSSLESLQNIDQTLTDNQSTEATAGVQMAVESNTAVSLIGKGVEIPSDVVTYTGTGSVQLGYNLAGPATRVDVRIFNESGSPVRTLSETNPSEGNGTVYWDGKDADGGQLPAGTYYIVPSAVNGVGNPVVSSAVLAGTVTGVRYEGTTPILVMDGGEAPLSGVSRVYQLEAD